MSNPLLRILLPVVILAIAGAVTAQLAMNRPEAQQRDAAPPVLYVQTLPAVPRTERLQVRAQGTVGPRVETTLVSEVSGQVVARDPSFVAGGFFRRGQVLLEIDPRNYRAEAARSEAMVAQARTAIARELVLAGLHSDEWQRLRNLSIDDTEMEQLALRKPGLAQALAELESASAMLEKARGDLERTRIRAPYDGLVRQRLADIGQFVNAGTPLAETFAVDRAEVRLPLKQNDLPFLELPPPGAEQAPEDAPRVELSADLGGQRHQWSGRLVRTEGVFDPRSQVLYGVVEVDDPYGLDASAAPEIAARTAPLRMGTFVSAVLEGRVAEDVIRLPRHTLRPGDRIWVVAANETIEPRDVNVLRRDESWVWVDAGLEAGARVTTTPVANPLAGTPVRLTEDLDREAFAARTTDGEPGT
jgi:RND family efflux transporter MFP subunit